MNHDLGGESKVLRVARIWEEDPGAKRARIKRHKPGSRRRILELRGARIKKHEP